MILLFFSTLLYMFHPAAAGRRWANASPLQALALGAIHLVALGGWAYLLLATINFFGRYSYHVVEGPFAVFRASLRDAPHELFDILPMPSLMDRIIAAALPILLLVLFFMMLFFILLPFAARPGTNRSCIRHTLRTVFLSTGAVHLIFFTLNAVLFWQAIMPHSSGVDLRIRLCLLVLLPLALWIFAALIRIVRTDYRKSADLPQPHDPWCDQCGYNLTGVDPDHRCPECGKPILESIGPHTRPPTAWERNPLPLRIGSILTQIQKLIIRPRDLFFSMPTLTGQPAAQRWLLLSILGVGLLAFLILPTIHFGFLAFDLSLGDILLRSAAVGFVWAILGLMMVGIETSGIATFSRMKQHPGGGVPLATAAKVTAYSSVLMLPWVFLGFAQILASLYWFDSDYGPKHHTIRGDQIFIAASLAIAHIGGLLWYELTVYRGIKAVQYANK